MAVKLIEEREGLAQAPAQSLGANGAILGAGTIEEFTTSEPGIAGLGKAARAFSEPQQAPVLAPVPAQPALAPIALLIGLALRVLSERTILGLYHLLPILALSSAFVLWTSVMNEPSTNQLIGSGLYAIFMLALTWLVRRR